MLGGTSDGALLVASLHQPSGLLRPFLFVRDEAGTWQLRSQLPDAPTGWIGMDRASQAIVFRSAADQLTLHRFGPDLFELPSPRPRRRRTTRPTATVTTFVPDQEGGLGELLAASGDLVAVTLGTTVHLMRFDASDELVTEQVITHPDELLPGALAAHGRHVAIIWEDLGDRVATPQVFARAADGTWAAEPMERPRGSDGGWAEPCIVMAGDWLVYGRRGDADGHPSYLCGWCRGSAGWTQAFEVQWPRAPHSIDLDREGQRLLVASEWEDRVDVCALTEAGLGAPSLVTAQGGPAVFDDDVVIVARRNGIHAFAPTDEGWTEVSAIPLAREVTDDLIADGGLVYAASSLVGGVGVPTGEVHVLRRDDEGGYATCLVFRDYCQGVEGYDVGGTLAAAGRRALVGFEHRYDGLGGIQVASFEGIDAPES